MTREVTDNNFVALEGLWLLTNTTLLIIYVYAPQEIGAKKVLWDRLMEIIKRRNEEVIIMVDFNEVLDAQERYGSIFNSHHANIFKEFLYNATVVDVPLDGYMFSLSDNEGSKMSKIDRFFVLEGLLETFPHLFGLILTRHLSDHRPLLLHEVFSDFGPKLFRIYSSWFLEDDFYGVVANAWNHVVNESNSRVRLRTRLNSSNRKLEPGLKQKWRNEILIRKNG
jgi:hypothetical protein